MRRPFKTGVLASLLAVIALTTSCYGPFQLTRNLHTWNGSIQNKWGAEGIFLALLYIPVYPVCMVGDALIFNSIVFWGGSNPTPATVQAGSGGKLDTVAAAYGLNIDVTTRPVQPAR